MINGKAKWQQTERKRGQSAVPDRASLAYFKHGAKLAPVMHQANLYLGHWCVRATPPRPRSVPQSCTGQWPPVAQGNLMNRSAQAICSEPAGPFNIHATGSRVSISRKFPAPWRAADLLGAASRDDPVWSCGKGSLVLAAIDAAHDLDPRRLNCLAGDFDIACEPPSVGEKFSRPATNQLRRRPPISDQGRRNHILVQYPCRGTAHHPSPVPACSQCKCGCAKSDKWFNRVAQHPRSRIWARHRDVHPMANACRPRSRCRSAPPTSLVQRPPPL